MKGGPMSLLLLALGTAIGVLCQRASYARVTRLTGWLSAFQSVRLLLSEARSGVGDVLARAARMLPEGQTTARSRLLASADALAADPSLSVGEAYALACRAHPAGGETSAEREALQTAFELLGQGTAAMREQAAVTCAQQLKALLAAAEESAQKRGRLYGRLGALGGAALAILFW